METPYTPPEVGKSSFHCPDPICRAFAAQHWSERVVAFNVAGKNREVPDLRIALCAHCTRLSIWHMGKLLFPAVTGAPPPNGDLRDDIRDDYREAADIANRSPRGAAALLRLAVQKLCGQLNQDGKNLNDDIAALVEKGLPSRIQQALDIVRVVGNNAVHPGQIDLKDDAETASNLFNLINLIADVMLTQPKHVAAAYEALPEGARMAIEERDAS